MEAERVIETYELAGPEIKVTSNGYRHSVWVAGNLERSFNIRTGMEEKIAFISGLMDELIRPEGVSRHTKKTACI